MKDYRLSEIQNHNFNELWALSDDIAKRRIEFEFLRNAQYSLEHLDIEPRDMIELPCKIPYNVGDTCEVRYFVLYMKDNGNVSITNGYTEAQANTVLAELKGDKE